VKLSEIKETKVKAFENLKFFQVWEESTKAQKEQQLPLDQTREEI
jgi:hypothetical protein